MLASDKLILPASGVGELSSGRSARIRQRGGSRSCRFLALMTVLAISLFLSISTFIVLQFGFQTRFQISLPPPRQICHDPAGRRSWHALTLDSRRDYIDAVERLASLPSRLGLNTSLYDDFTYVHIQVVWETHHLALSLPFHRYFLHVFEQALRTETGYNGYVPYWDWTLDASSPLESPVWFSRFGFGGNGSTATGGCVEDGIFARIGKQANYSRDGYDPHCVRRVFVDSKENGMMHSTRWNRSVIDGIMHTAKSYKDLRLQIEDGPHRYLHRGIGGEMPTESSTNDPIFFLHHAQIDRLWWQWQQTDPARHVWDYSGPKRTGDENDEDEPEAVANLEDKIKLLGLAKDVAVRDVMRTDSSIMCYRY